MGASHVTYKCGRLEVFIVERMVRFACGIVVISIAASHNAHGEVHPSVTTVVSEGDVIDGRTVLRLSEDDSNIAINDTGEIAFHAEVYWNGANSWGVMTNRRFVAGAGKVIDGIVPLFNSEDQSVDINNSGNVAYTAWDESTSRFSVFVDETRLYHAGGIVDGVAIGTIERDIDMNNAGEIVAFGFRDLPVLAPGEVVWSGGRIVLQSDDNIDGIPIHLFESPQINESGDIVAQVHMRGLEPGLPTDAIVTRDSIVFKPGDVVEDTEIQIVRRIGSYLDDGTIVANVNVGRNENGQLLSAIVTQREVLLRPGDIVDEITFDGLLGGSVVVMNNRHQLAFLSWPYISGVGDPKNAICSRAAYRSRGRYLSGQNHRDPKAEFQPE